MTFPSNAFPSPTVLSTALAPLGVLLLLASVLHAADEPAPPKPRDWEELTPGTAITLQVKAWDGSIHGIRFRYCPAGELVLGDASVETADIKPMKPFLMMETELGVGLAHWLAPPEVWQKIKNRVLPLNDPDAKSGLAAPDTAGSIPLTYINLDEAASICDAASHAGIAVSAIPLSPIEAWELRLPTHAEWQYSCRSSIDRDSARKFPHFSPWPKYEDMPKTVKGNCADQWEGRLGRRAATFTGTQLQIISLFEKYDKGENPGPAEILGQFMAKAWWRDPSSRVYTAGSMTGPPQATDTLLPNAWGLRGMSDNACEWAVCVSAPNDVRSFCAALTDDNEASAALSQAVVFLAGGSTREYIEAKQDWQVYAVWGGRPMREDGTGIDPQTWASANGGSPLVEEHAAGCRFVADRVLSAEWAAQVRSDALLADAKETVDQYFRRCEATIDEIMAKQDQAEALRILASYEAVARYRVNDMVGTKSALAAKLRSRRPPEKKPKITVDDIFGNPTPAAASKPSTTTPANEDDLFSQALLVVVSAETAKD